jgi:hypothetical protein
MTMLPAPTSSARRWYPLPLVDRAGRTYLVSFRIAEEATWDHRFHDSQGREISADELTLLPADHLFIQSRCDSAVGERKARPHPTSIAGPAAPRHAMSALADRA